MNDPLARATSCAPPIVGEGCTARYDPSALTDTDGTEFPGAQALWEALHPPQGTDHGSEPAPRPAGRSRAIARE